MDRDFIRQKIIDGKYDDIEKLLIDKSEKFSIEGDFLASDELAFSALQFKSTIKKHGLKKRRKELKSIEKEINDFELKNKEVKEKLIKKQQDLKHIKNYFLRVADYIAPHRFLGDPNDKIMKFLTEDLGYLSDNHPYQKNNKISSIVKNIDSFFVEKENINRVRKEMLEQLDLLTFLPKQQRCQEESSIKFELLYSSSCIYVREGRYLEYVNWLDELDAIKNKIENIASDTESLMNQYSLKGFPKALFLKDEISNIEEFLINLVCYQLKLSES